MGNARNVAFWVILFLLILALFNLFSGNQSAVNPRVVAYSDFISKQPGFVAAGLHVNDAQTRIANYSQWRRREDFLAMLRTPEMRARNRRFNELCKSFEPVMYDVAATF